MKKIFLFGCFIFGTLVHAAECNNPMLHRNQQPMSGIFLELTPLTPCTLESGFYQIETMLQASNTIVIDSQEELSASRMILAMNAGNRHLSSGLEWDLKLILD